MQDIINIDKSFNNDKMRILLLTTKNESIVPFGYQDLLAGVIHRWLGVNELHDKISLYSFSWLNGASLCKFGFNFERGSQWFISFHENVYLKTIIKSIQTSPEMFCGMRVTDVIIKDAPDFTYVEDFILASPILLKERHENTIKHLIYTDENVEKLLEYSIKHKMSIANIPEDDSFKISIDRFSRMCKTKIVKIHDISNKSFYCPIHIIAKNKTKQFIWNVGLGHSTGVGFGSIY